MTRRSIKAKLLLGQTAYLGKVTVLQYVYPKPLDSDPAENPPLSNPPSDEDVTISTMRLQDQTVGEDLLAQVEMS